MNQPNWLTSVTGKGPIAISAIVGVVAVAVTAAVVAVTSGNGASRVDSTPNQSAEAPVSDAAPQAVDAENGVPGAETPGDPSGESIAGDDGSTGPDDEESPFVSGVGDSSNSNRPGGTAGVPPQALGPGSTDSSSRPDDSRDFAGATSGPVGASGQSAGSGTVLNVRPAPAQDQGRNPAFDPPQPIPEVPTQPAARSFTCTVQVGEAGGSELALISVAAPSNVSVAWATVSSGSSRTTGTVTLIDGNGVLAVPMPAGGVLPKVTVYSSPRLDAGSLACQS